jgi:hypothetical protein
MNIFRLGPLKLKKGTQLNEKLIIFRNVFSY